MALEAERKYLHPDLNLLRKRLSQSGAAFAHRAWENNLVLDTPEKTLRRNNILLRLRHADTTTLTLKKKPESSLAGMARLKILEELETAVADKAAMLAILMHLGFMIAFRYEKLRETWQWRNCTICLDILPFMEAVELEGDPASIDQTAVRFGLEGLEASTMTYHQLHQAHRHTLDLPPQEDYVFSQEQKARIVASIAPENQD